VVFVVTLGLGPDAAVGARWVKSWFAPGQPFLAYPSAANLRWLRQAGFDLEPDHDPEAISDDLAQRIADAFGLFGSPERCADRLLRAREESGVRSVFLFPAHDLAGGYQMPEAEVVAFSSELSVHGSDEWPALLAAFYGCRRTRWTRISSMMSCVILNSPTRPLCRLARPIPSRPTASRPMAIVPTASAPKAKAPTAAAPIASAPSRRTAGRLRDDGAGTWPTSPAECSGFSHIVDSCSVDPA
jgi:hypothetical protein